jgi:predicted patatin/cPLA2 family phospholipase
VLCPDQALSVNHTEHDPEKLQEAYDEGRKVALRELDKIKEFMNS